MGWRGTLLLAALLIAFGLFVWLEEVPPEAPERPGTLLGEPRTGPLEESQLLLKFDPQDVAAIRLQQGEQTHAVEREAGEWRGVENADAIDDFLKNISGLGRIMEIPAKPGELADYGLQPAHSALELQLRGGAHPIVVEIGDRNPAVTGVYVRLNRQGPVVLAGALVTWEFDKAFKAIVASGG